MIRDDTDEQNQSATARASYSRFGSNEEGTPRFVVFEGRMIIMVTVPVFPEKSRFKALIYFYKVRMFSTSISCPI